MNPSVDARRRRVREGSRRERDLEVAEPEDLVEAKAAESKGRPGRPDFVAFVTAHFLDDLPRRAQVAAERLYLADPERKLPTPDAVRAEMEAMGWTKAQIEAKYGVGVQ